MASTEPDYVKVLKETELLKKYFRVDVTLTNASILDLRPVYQISFNPQFIHQPDFEIDNLSQDEVKLFFDSVYGLIKALKLDTAPDHILEFHQMVKVLGNQYAYYSKDPALDETGLAAYFEAAADPDSDVYPFNTTEPTSMTEEEREVAENPLVLDFDEKLDPIDDEEEAHLDDQITQPVSAASDQERQNAEVKSLFGGESVSVASVNDSSNDQNVDDDDDYDPFDGLADDVDDDDGELVDSPEADDVEADSAEAPADFAADDDESNFEADDQIDDATDADSDDDDLVEDDAAVDLPDAAFEVDQLASDNSAENVDFDSDQPAAETEPNAVPEEPAEQPAHEEDFDPYQKSSENPTFDESSAESDPETVSDQSTEQPTHNEDFDPYQKSSVDQTSDQEIADEPATEAQAPIDDEDDDDDFSILVDEDDDGDWYKQAKPASKAPEPPAEPASANHDHHGVSSPQIDVDPDRFFNGSTIIRKFK